MPILHWDFVSPYPSVRIKGSINIRSADDAIKIRDIMNQEHGDDSHWVETLNWIWEERSHPYGKVRMSDKMKELQITAISSVALRGAKQVASENLRTLREVVKTLKEVESAESDEDDNARVR